MTATNPGARTRKIAEPTIAKILLSTDTSKQGSGRRATDSNLAHPSKATEVRNCLTDEGRSLGVGLQEQAPNHRRRLWPKATVVNAEGKGSDVTGAGDGQEEDRKGTTAEVSKVTRRWPKPQLVVTAGPTPTIPAYGRSGIRHERWPELAMRRLNGTWET